MTRLTIRGIAARLILFTAAMAVLLLIVVQAIQRPVAGETSMYSATFTDVNGLKTGDDVRMFGVQVGKVTKISITGSAARVEFTLQNKHPIYEESTVAIRFQSLVGQRYIDIRQPDEPGNRLPSHSAISSDHTVPSFDITQLFNGLQPVLSELSPGAINQFAESTLAVINGDGSGIGSAMDALDQLSRYAADRQTVISTIINNLSTISDQIGGKSPHLVTLIQQLAGVFEVFEQKIDGLIDFADIAPSGLGPLNDLLGTLGLTENSGPDLRALFPDPEQAVDLLGKVPGLIQSLSALLPPALPAGQVNLTCSKGKSPVPEAFQVLIGGQRIAICKP
ncbi:MCE family protein [Nocardia vaccinii]|uniref:MCE family protein n=1 Tax=Nocardia vaccinii TaxID=1822 RepID=UPI000A845261|nr:MCE family protein [Nocardia vaccinii]